MRYSQIIRLYSKSHLALLVNFGERVEANMNDIISIENITGLIHLIRGKKVILDRDLASLYDVESRVLKQAVRRNIKRFPEDFMFDLTLDEDRSLRSQNVTLKRGLHSKYPPMVFTEQGIPMLSSAPTMQPFP